VRAGAAHAGPIMASLRFFEQEFLAHIDDHICPAGQCKPLVRAKCINTCPAAWIRLRIWRWWRKGDSMKPSPSIASATPSR